ncbi:MAG: hypothetical protein IH831_05630 [Planctomycetes bacterium]|nr:hypothetical protein [Planctomycetota bacterium]
MSIRIECPHCGKGIKAPSKLAGKKSTCPGCGQQIEIPGIPIPVVCTRASWIDRALLLAILFVLLVGLSPQIPWINKTPLATAPMPVVIENRWPIDVNVQNTVDVEVENTFPIEVEVKNISPIEVKIEDIASYAGTLDVEVQNTSLDVEVQNTVDVSIDDISTTDELRVNLFNHYITGGDPIPVRIER